jgi:hypothetical protein
MPVILGGNTGIYLASLTPPASPLILDTYPNAAVAYSLRKLRTAYTGAAIRVRRSSDNAEQDINFVSGNLDSQSLLDFVGYNLLTYSEDISQVIWAKTNLNTTGIPPYLDVEIAPDGLTTADKIIENITSGTHQCSRQNLTIINATSYNTSVYVKQGERTKVQIISNISGTTQTCDVDLTNGNISNNGFANTPVVTAEANGWYRFSVTIISGSTAVNSIGVRLMNPTTSYLGDGTSGAYIWGAQLSQSSSVLPYTKTVADVSRNGFITTWYDQSENSKNATQVTAINQPRIVNLGALDVVNGKPAVLGDGINDTLTNNTLSLTNPSSIFTVVDKISAGGNFGLTVGGSVGGGFILSATGYGIYQNGPSFSPEYANNNQSLLVYKTSSTGTNWEFYGNNTTVINGGQNIGSTLGNFVSLFDRAAGSSRANMYMQEYIIWNSNQMTNRLGIQTNINSFYTIY